MVYQVRFNEEKNQLLKATRGVCFEDVLLAIKNKKMLANKKHPNSKFNHQRVYIVMINNYVYAVPYVINDKKKEIFLKTIYPSRVLTKQYIKGGQHEK